MSDTDGRGAAAGPTDAVRAADYVDLWLPFPTTDLDRAIRDAVRDAFLAGTRAERAACAKVAEDESPGWEEGTGIGQPYMRIAAAIRARG